MKSKDLIKQKKCMQIEKTNDPNKKQMMWMKEKKSCGDSLLITYTSFHVNFTKSNYNY
jgi:hypothetical protein